MSVNKNGEGKTIVELTVFSNIMNDDCIQAILGMNRPLVLKKVIRFAETNGVTDDAVREYVVSFLANDDNIVSYLAQGNKKIGEDLYDLALADMEKIFVELLSRDIIYRRSGNKVGFFDGYTKSIKTLSKVKTAKQFLDMLIEHYKTLGCGILSKYIAFKFDGELVGVGETDEVTFDSLVGLEYQKQILIDNTSAFVKGKSANNVLLFGDRGTGKSSSVKALLNMFNKDGLRIIEMPKSNIKDIPRLTKELSNRPHKYILFLDDLSFETHETEYRALKIAMEGQLQAHPDNVLIYATSNRRHLIRENWSDREGGEVHVNDQMQETLSLSERFGISLVFSAPNQREYLHIVSELLSNSGVSMTADIEKQAIVWQMNYGGRSARCAKQFVSSYVAKM